MLESAIYAEPCARPGRPPHGQVIRLHIRVWDVITYPCSRQQASGQRLYIYICKFICIKWAACICIYTYIHMYTI